MKALVHREERKNRSTGKDRQRHQWEQRQGRQGQGFGSVPKGSLETEYNEVLTTIEAANYLRVSVGTLHNMTSNGSVPHTKLGNRNRYFLNELRELLLSNKKGGSHGF